MDLQYVQESNLISWKRC